MTETVAIDRPSVERLTTQRQSIVAIAKVVQVAFPSDFIETCLPSKVARPSARLQRPWQLGLPTVLNGATRLAYAKEPKGSCDGSGRWRRRSRR